MALQNASGARKTAVISGGGGGLGMALSARLQKDGWRVVLLDLDIAHLAQTDTQLARQCDVTDAEALQRCCAEILETHDSIDLVVYGAGVTAIAPVDALQDIAHRRLFDINYFAAVAMAQAFQQAVRAARGTHLAITSVAGFAPLRHRASYAASKHAMTGFFSTLRVEERPFGVRTIIAAPAFVATNTGRPDADSDGLARPGSAKDAIDPMTPEQAADVILKGLKRGKPMIPVGRVAALTWRVMRVSPSLYDWLMARMISGGKAAKS